MGKIDKSGQTLSKKEVQHIVNAINHSKEQYKDMANERNLGLSNGRYLDRWNYIFANVRDSFNYEPFLTFNVNRGPLWEFIFIYNTDNKILYLLLKEDTFKNIRDDKKNPHHYARAFNSKNSNYVASNIEQLSMLPQKEILRDKYIEEDLKNMLSDINDEVQTCKNILYKENFNGVNKITENIANYHLDILDSHDLTRYITADIDNIVDTKNNIVDLLPRIELKIRKGKTKKREEIISDKSKTDEENKNDNKN